MSIEPKKIAVLVGGWGSEREVSLSSGREVARALKACGHDIQIIDVNQDLSDLYQRLIPKPDLAFLCAIHGKWMEDGCLQGFLEMMGIAYTNSGPMASSLAMHKAMARQLFQAAGIPVAEGGVYTRCEIEAGHVMQPPYIIKPVSEGSSVGVQVVHQDTNLHELHETWKYGDTALVEKFIPGREVQVLIMGDRAVGSIEIQFDHEFCDYKTKYTKNFAKRVVPAPIHVHAHTQLLELALKAHQALQCEGVSRVDFRYDDTAGEPGQLYILEVNTQPGMTPTSFAPAIAAHHGICFEALVQWMVDNPKRPL